MYEKVSLASSTILINHCRHANKIHREKLEMSSQSHTVRSLYNSSVWHDPHCSEFSGRFGYRVVTCCHRTTGMRLDKIACGQTDTIKVEFAFLFYAQALTILLYTYKRFQGTSRPMRMLGLWHV